ncbi:MAG: hypothetical protein JOY69_06960 [Candidatus Eremiobacteraeota bacterium]|nr:hypothetical protein [Candidatus Eremiobacteraeota bacterium]MBV8372984.1 hypothetical protein [Candidatus Eremiobacteraeota bacterium]
MKPSATDARITNSDVPHVVIYDRAAPAGNLLLFMPGTGGEPPGPLHFLNGAVAHGYRVISLSYVDTPAVAQVCIGSALAADPQCAEHFRAKRIYGNGGAAPIDDAPQDSIMNRFVKLLQYLENSDPRGGWDRYLSGDTPIWAHIAVAGQSQGGGMAEFIAQREVVARVVIFSGGWDRSSWAKIATWYSNKSVTPLDRWFATYNVAEAMAQVLSETYTALGIPASHVFALHLPVRPGMKPHGEGDANPAYEDVWNQMLGSGAP